MVAGTRAEADRMGVAFTAIPGVTSVMGQTSIPELAALVAAADLVLCGNSSALHLADALRRPVVTIYSGTELNRSGVPARRPRSSCGVRRHAARATGSNVHSRCSASTSSPPKSPMRACGCSADLGSQAEDVACAVSAS